MKNVVFKGDPFVAALLEIQSAKFSAVKAVAKSSGSISRALLVLAIAAVRRASLSDITSLSVSFMPSCDIPDPFLAVSSIWYRKRVIGRLLLHFLPLCFAGNYPCQTFGQL